MCTNRKYTLKLHQDQQRYDIIMGESSGLQVACVCDCPIEQIIEFGFSRMTYNEKLTVISNGRPKPNLKELVNVGKKFSRHFSTELYKHQWLTGCEKFQSTFCWPCLLFGQDRGVWRTKGMSDLQNIHKAIKRHENSADHLMCVLSLSKFGKEKRIECHISEAFAKNINIHNEKVRENLKILQSLIDATCYLCEHELPFRGHD